ncbi:MAG: hypothetical protein JO235_02515 [Chroococcidiopsidaceae cyanobacterium CP_BM_RX_35]|nr:hypothetical protein [Chroococcidiopsidaceae cyanobacterium CP_BM_RX_35]
MKDGQLRLSLLKEVAGAFSGEALSIQLRQCWRWHLLGFLTANVLVAPIASLGIEITP